MERTVPKAATEEIDLYFKDNILIIKVNYRNSNSHS